jgi:hypothetical protein
MIKKKNKPFIFIREIEDAGKFVAEFSSKIDRHDSDEDIAACAAQCIAASKGKGWGSTSKPTAYQIVLTWELLADSTLANLQPASICNHHQASVF